MKHVVRNVSGVAVSALAAWLTVSRHRRQRASGGATHGSPLPGAERLRAPAPDFALLNSELQTRLREEAHELALAKADLRSVEDFLQGEMRAGIAEIRALGAIMKESRPGEGTRHESRARAVETASQRLDEATAALASLAKLSRVELQVADIDLTSIAAGILAQLQEHDRRRVVVTHVQEGLRARGDHALLRSALDLLLRNAWERTERSRLATITLTTHGLADGQPIYCVKDNGTPLDAVFTRNLFDNLSHVQAKEDFRAAGIGLATVRGIVRRHAGRMWIGAAEEGNSKIHFTLGAPKAPNFLR